MMEMLHAISLRNPWWLLLALQPFVLWALAGLRRRIHQDDFADAALLPWVRSPHKVITCQLWRPVLVVLAWSLLAIAMAGPRVMQRIIDPDSGHYLNLQVVVDLSFSMSARDVTPTRLERVKLELHDLVARMQQTRMGIIVYAARAHVMVPATADKAVLRHALDQLRVRQLPTEGSEVLAALSMARQQFAPAATQARAILLISDGEFNRDTAQAQQQLRDLLAAMRADNIHVYALGVGTMQGAALLNDDAGWLQHEGQAVVTRLQAERLQALAQEGNGEYAEVADDDSEWRTLYDHGMARLPVSAREEAAAPLVIWQELSAWFVLPGMLLLLLAYLQAPHPHTHTAPLLLLCALACSGVLHSPPTQAAATDYPAAYAAYHKGEYAAAARGFSRLPGYAARMGEGASRYQLQQYPQAASVFIQAVLAADSDEQRAQALFNLGNCYFKQASYARAISSYRDALRYQATLTAAHTNLEYALALQQSSATGENVQVTRAGTGPGSGSPVPNLDLSQGRVSIDESASKPETPLPASVDTSPQLGTARGLLEQAQPATGKIERDADVRWTYDITQAQDITPAETRFDVDEAVLWQRLYETEEDFPAPRERPEQLPGVTPW